MKPKPRTGVVVVVSYYDIMVLSTVLVELVYFFDAFYVHSCDVASTLVHLH